MRNRRRDHLAKIRGSLGHAMRAGCHTANALDHFVKSFVQLHAVREGDFKYVRNCAWWAEQEADAALAELEAAEGAR